MFPALNLSTLLLLYPDLDESFFQTPWGSLNEDDGFSVFSLIEDPLSGFFRFPAHTPSSFQIIRVHNAKAHPSLIGTYQKENPHDDSFIFMYELLDDPDQPTLYFINF